MSPPRHDAPMVFRPSPFTGHASGHDHPDPLASAMGQEPVLSAAAASSTATTGKRM
ncbi:hypothetical protein RAA17_00380 [Komagataeibacter rhaeticus]|nr:hypothetical protein [Komagataeibacter rhaeticus]